MKITSLGSSPLMSKGLLSGFQILGYEVSYFPIRDWFSMSEEDGLKCLEEDLKNSKCDFFIYAGYYPKYFLEIPNLCKKYNCKFIYWSIEDPCGFNKTLDMCKKADYVFTTTYECIKKYKQNNIEVELLLFACNPQYHKLGNFNNNYNYDITIQASYYVWESRQRGFDIILDSAKETQYSLSVWGAGWERENGILRLGNKNLFKGYFPNDKLGDLCASSKILLGVQCDDTSITQTSMRPFEILSCGGFHLTQWTKATENLFEDTRHLVMSKCKEQTKELINYYIKHEDERNRIRQNGFQYVRENHTYLHRVRDVVLPFIFN